MFSTIFQANVLRCVAFAPARPTQATLSFQLTSGMGPASRALVLELFRSTSLPPIETYKSLHHLPVSAGSMSSLLVSAAALLTVCGCCFIPRLKKLFQRLIDTKTNQDHLNVLPDRAKREQLKR